LREARAHVRTQVNVPPQPLSFPRAPQGTPAGPPLSHPERHVQTVRHRALPGSEARRRGCHAGRAGGAAVRGGRCIFYPPPTGAAPKGCLNFPEVMTLDGRSGLR